MRETNTGNRSHMKVEARAGVLQSGAKDHLGPPEAGGDRGPLLQNLLREFYLLIPVNTRIPDSGF